MATAVGLVVAAAGLVPAGCRVDRAEFERRVFQCNTGAPGQTCGTDATGRPMACFAASQVGGTDFCARTCDYDPDGGAPPSGGVCLKSSEDHPNIELSTCKPSDDTVAAPTAACGQPDLRCYRTDLVADEGVCTTMSPCARDEECTDTTRSVCASTFLADTVYPAAMDAVKLDHMFCLQTGCKARGTSCSPGESCLQLVVPPSTNPPDICVPDCDSNLNCPPNFLCYRRVSTVVTPKVCIPGLLGFTCLDDMDCMVGSCVNTGIGYKVCTTRCDTDADCMRFDGIQGLFLCIKNDAQPADPGYCRSPNSFRGSDCMVDDDCHARNADEVCAKLDSTNPLGTCLLPCPTGQLCPRRGGIEHTCLDPGGGAPPVCFPGYFGLPCVSDESCVDDHNQHDLSCLPGAPAATSICTKTCAGDGDCTADRWMTGNSWCDMGAGLCRPLIATGSTTPCPDNSACQSGTCSTSHLCVAAEGTGG